MCPGYPWDVFSGYPTKQRQTRTFGFLSSKKNGVCLNCQGCTKNGAPYIVWPGPPTEGRAISALLAAGTEPATLLAYRCWVVGWAAPVTRMALTGLGWGVAQGKSHGLCFITGS